jgi:hypothetical protein
VQSNEHGNRLRRKELRAAVAQALLHLGDITRLADSPLVDLPQVRRRWQGSAKLFAEGQAVRDVLEEAAGTIIDRLAGDGKVALLRATLEGILQHQSVSSIARARGKSREHFSRTYWKLAAGLVADEILALNGDGRMRYNAGKVRKPSP